MRQQPEEKNATSSVSSVAEPDHKGERSLVWRLDLFFLTIGFLGYAFKYLDQTNIVSFLLYPRKARCSWFG